MNTLTATYTLRTLRTGRVETVLVVTDRKGLVIDTVTGSDRSKIARQDYGVVGLVNGAIFFKSRDEATMGRNSQVKRYAAANPGMLEIVPISGTVEVETRPTVDSTITALATAEPTIDSAIAAPAEPVVTIATLAAALNVTPEDVESVAHQIANEDGAEAVYGADTGVGPLIMVGTLVVSSGVELTAHAVECITDAFATAQPAPVDTIADLADEFRGADQLHHGEPLDDNSQAWQAGHDAPASADPAADSLGMLAKVGATEDPESQWLQDILAVTRRTLALALADFLEPNQAVSVARTRARRLQEAREALAVAERWAAESAQAEIGAEDEAAQVRALAEAAEAEAAEHGFKSYEAIAARCTANESAWRLANRVGKAEDDRHGVQTDIGWTAEWARDHALVVDLDLPVPDLDLPAHDVALGEYAVQSAALVTALAEAGRVALLEELARRTVMPVAQLTELPTTVLMAMAGDIREADEDLLGSSKAGPVRVDPDRGVFDGPGQARSIDTAAVTDPEWLAEAETETVAPVDGLEVHQVKVGRTMYLATTLGGEVRSVREDSHSPELAAVGHVVAQRAGHIVSAWIGLEAAVGHALETGCAVYPVGSTIHPLPGVPARGDRFPFDASEAVDRLRAEAGRAQEAADRLANRVAEAEGPRGVLTRLAEAERQAEALTATIARLRRAVTGVQGTLDLGFSDQLPLG